MMAAGMEAPEIENRLNRTVHSFSGIQCPVFLVSNEVGYGIVPENALARRFRDLAGQVNQVMADAVDRVVLTVAGQALQIKPGANPVSP
jgi:adenosylcobinamide kinase/adenosylcobinamide-phosphate guanylyltransferase